MFQFLVSYYHSFFINKQHIQTNLFLDDDSLQNSNTVIGIIKASLQRFKATYPEVEEMWLRCDNAGAYHSQLFIQALYALRNQIPGLIVKGLVFNEPGISYVFNIQKYACMYQISL